MTHFAHCTADITPAVGQTRQDTLTGKSMRQTLARKLAPVLAAAAVVVGATVAPGSATAALVEQSFTLAPDFGPLAGPVTGSFLYDDDTAPITSPFGDSLIPLIGFSLELGGNSLDVDDAQEAFAAFNGDGFIGLVVTVDGVLTMSPAVGTQSAFFAASGRAGESMGTVRFSEPQARVSEPAGAALALLGLAALGALRRRR